MHARRPSLVVAAFCSVAACAGAQVAPVLPAPDPPHANPEAPAITDNLLLLRELVVAADSQLVPLIVIADSNGAQTRTRQEMGWQGYPDPGTDITGGHLQGLMFALRDLALLGGAGSRGMGGANFTNTGVMGGHTAGDDGRGAAFQGYTFDSDTVATFSDASDVEITGAGVNGLELGEVADETTNPAFGSIRPDFTPFTPAEIEGGEIYLSLRGLGAGSGLSGADVGAFAPTWRASFGADLFCPGSLSVTPSTDARVVRWRIDATDGPEFDHRLDFPYVARWYRRDAPALDGSGAMALNAWGYIPALPERPFATGFEASMGVQYGGRNLTDVLEILLVKTQRQWNHWWSIHCASQQAMGIPASEQRAAVCVIFKGNDYAASVTSRALIYNGVGVAGTRSGLQTRTPEGYALNVATLRSVLADSWAASGRSPDRLTLIEYPYHLRSRNETFNMATLDMQQAVSHSAIPRTAVVFGMRIWNDGFAFAENDYYRVASDEGHGWNGNPRWLAGLRERAGYNWFHHTVWSRLLELIDQQGDANHDGAVGFDDIACVIEHWEERYAPSIGPGDADGDGMVGFADLTAVLRAWSAG